MIYCLLFHSLIQRKIILVPVLYIFSILSRDKSENMQPLLGE